MLSKAEPKHSARDKHGSTTFCHEELGELIDYLWIFMAFISSMQMQLP
jgi:hypothetical protein